MLKNIEAERGRKMMTKQALSEALGISQTTYNKYVCGAPIPSDILIAMANLFECRIDYLLGLSDHRTT